MIIVTLALPCLFGLLTGEALATMNVAQCIAGMVNIVFALQFLVWCVICRWSYTRVVPKRRACAARYGDVDDPQPVGCMCLDCATGSTAFEDMQTIKNIVSAPSLMPLGPTCRWRGLTDRRCLPSDPHHLAW